MNNTPKNPKGAGRPNTFPKGLEIATIQRRVPKAVKSEIDQYIDEKIKPFKN